MTCIKRNLDTQNCCNQWQKGIRTIDGQYPDDNREFEIRAGTGVTITPITAGIEISAALPAPPVPGPMTFRGTLGTGGTITSLPPATSANIGDVYVALESGTVPVTYETGDMVISNGITWVVIPSGDDPVDWSQILNTPDTIAGYGITDAYTKAEIDATFVDLPSTQAITGVKTVPLETTRTFSDQIASSNKVKNELDNYTPMVRTTGNQEIAGEKLFSTAPRVKIDAPLNSTVRKARALFVLKDTTTGNTLMELFYVNTGEGTAQFEARMYRINGTYATSTLGTVTL